MRARSERCGEGQSFCCCEGPNEAVELESSAGALQITLPWIHNWSLRLPSGSILELDLIADFACPWSYLGKRSLERALVNLQGFPAPALRWHGFRAQPDGKAEAADRRSPGVHTSPRGCLRASRWTSRTRASPRRARGLAFTSTSPSSSSFRIRVKAHRLVALAAKDEKQSEVADGIFRAFFEEGRDIGDKAVIEAVGRESHLSEETLAAFANPEAGRDEIAAEEKRLRGFGCRGDAQPADQRASARAGAGGRVDVRAGAGSGAVPAAAFGQEAPPLTRSLRA